MTFELSPTDAGISSSEHSTSVHFEVLSSILCSRAESYWHTKCCLYVSGCLVESRIIGRRLCHTVTWRFVQQDNHKFPFNASMHAHNEMNIWGHSSVIHLCLCLNLFATDENDNSLSRCVHWPYRSTGFPISMHSDASCLYMWLGHLEGIISLPLHLQIPLFSNAAYTFRQHLQTVHSHRGAAGSTSEWTCNPQEYLVPAAGAW